MTKRLAKLCLIGRVGMLVLLPTAAGAQSPTSGAIAGQVKDATGAVLPGVTVEASSPALIEKVRTVVSDGDGQYKIVELRPGTYTVTFTLAGFKTVKRDGIELTTGFTAPVSVQLEVGALEEAITVTGASPIVDTQNVRTQNVLSRQVLDSVPTAQALHGFAALTLGAVMATQDVGGNKGEAPASVSINGGRGNDQKMKQDGMSFNTFHTSGGGANRNFLLNQVGIAEMVLEVGGISAESETGGIQINAVPKDGGNRFTLYGNGNFTNESLQSDNLSAELRARGVATPPTVKTISDFGVGVGGPVKRDTLWFYAANRWWSNSEYRPGAYFNKIPDTWFYEPDLSRPAYRDQPNRDHGVRLTWQASRKNKITVSENVQRADQNFADVSLNTAPEASRMSHYGGHDGHQHLIQATWSNPLTNKLLLEAGTSLGIFFQTHERAPNVALDDIGVRELSNNLAYNALANTIFGVAYTEKDGQPADNTSHNLNWRGSVSYVTGSHAFKTGIQLIHGFHDQYRAIPEAISYTFRNQVPTSLTQWASPTAYRTRIGNIGLYAQDQWTIKRVTLNLGARFDAFDARTLEEHLPAARFVPARDWTPVENVPNWKDVSPRLGLAYDIFGDGKTAVKVSVGRYVQSQGVTIAELNHPSRTMVGSTNRTWNDSFFPVGDPRRGNFSPDCDLLSPVANQECGAMSDRLFGTTLVTTQYSPDVLDGFGVRDYDWQTSVSIQRELMPRVGLEFGYYRTQYGNFLVTDNLSVGPSDFSPFCISTPVDARIPGGGGPQLCGLSDIQPDKFGQVSNLVTEASHYGERSEVYDGFKLALNARLGGGGLVSGGVSTGQTVVDNCTVIDTTPEPFCRTTNPWRGQTQYKFSAVYPLPWDMSVSSVFQNLPGFPLAASYVATNAEVRPTLGRDLGQCRGAAACNGTVIVNNLFEPFTQFEDRLTQVDVRLTKTLRANRMRLRAMVDVYNVFNANTVLGVNTRYGPSWLQPSEVLAGRLLKFGAQFEF